jgi:hypothetical protein
LVRDAGDLIERLDDCRGSARAAWAAGAAATGAGIGGGQARRLHFCRIVVSKAGGDGLDILKGKLQQTLFRDLIPVKGHQLAIGERLSTVGKFRDLRGRQAAEFGNWGSEIHAFGDSSVFGEYQDGTWRTLADYHTAMCTSILFFGDVSAT